jgi:glycosyltransferase involved in cell wall biosynthesis
MADADLFLMPSRSESFGLAAVEAMACGLPVLLSEHVPVGRWAEQAGAGRQVACTPEAFAKTCDEMLSDQSVLKEMAERARSLAFQHFDVNKVVKRLLAQYQAILSNGQPLSDVQEFQFNKSKFGNVQ